MSGNSFTFKQFTVHQDRCAMKVGTDGTLLGAWAALERRDGRILNICKGKKLKIYLVFYSLICIFAELIITIE